MMTTSEDHREQIRDLVDTVLDIYHLLVVTDVQCATVELMLAAKQLQDIGAQIESHTRQLMYEE